MADVVLLADDIFFQAKILETAKKVGVEVKTVSTPEAVLQHPARLYIVDLNARCGLAAVEQLATAGNLKPVVAFLSHVQVDLAERARAAGCRQVLPRSKFTQELPALLAQAKPPGGS